MTCCDISKVNTPKLTSNLVYLTSNVLRFRALEPVILHREYDPGLHKGIKYYGAKVDIRVYT